MWIRDVILGFLGMAAGFTVAGGFVALITLLGVVPRFSAETKTANKAILYENALMAGVIGGNIVSMYSIKIPLGEPFLIALGVFSGIFVGALAVALAEIVDTFPIFYRRLSMRKGAPYLVVALALGKAVGSFIQFFLAR